MTDAGSMFCDSSRQLSSARQRLLAYELLNRVERDGRAPADLLRGWARDARRRRRPEMAQVFENWATLNGLVDEVMGVGQNSSTARR